MPVIYNRPFIFKLPCFWLQFFWLQISACVVALGLGSAYAQQQNPVPPENQAQNQAQGGGEAVFKPGSGFQFATQDKMFALAVGLRLQFLYTLNQRGDPAPGQDPWSHALELRRGRATMNGHAFGKHNRYRVQFHYGPREVSGAEGEVRLSALRDAVLTFDYLRDLTFQIGQYKVPLSRERMISSGRLQMGDRSIVNREFTLDRDLGFDLRSDNFLGLDLLRYYAGIFTGDGAGTFDQRSLGVLWVARVEVLPFGMFDDYSESVQKPSTKPQLSLGFGAAHIDDARKNQGILGAEPSDGGTTDTTHLAADLFLKWFAWSFQTEWIARWGKRNPGTNTDDTGQPIAADDPRDGFGVFVQSGYLIGAGVEVSGRYGTNRPLGDASSLTENSELGGAVSWYIEQHSLKLHLDYFRLWEARRISQGDDRVRVVLQLSL